MSSRLEQLRALASAEPDDADIHYMIAQELSKAGDTDGAVAAFDTCLALDHHYHYARYHKARALQAAERIGEAIDTVRGAIPIATSTGDGKAESELAALLDELTG